MAFCAKCGGKVDDTANFCVACGVKLKIEKVEPISLPVKNDRKYNPDLLVGNKDSSDKNNKENSSNNLVSIAILTILALVALGFFLNSSNSNYSLDQTGLELAATDCANEIIASNDVSDPDPSAQDSMMAMVGQCITNKNSKFICSPANGGSEGDPVCIWDPNAVKGPRIKMLDGVYNAFKEAGDPYYQ